MLPGRAARMAPMSLKLRRPVLGALAITAACVLFGSNSLMVKLTSSRVGPWGISFVRFAVGTLLSVAAILVVSRRSGTPASEGFRVTAPLAMAARAVLGFAQMTLFFVGVSATSSGRATLLMSTTSIFAALFGFLFFRERLSRLVFLGIASGFAGACWVLWDGSSYSLAGNLACLAAGAANGLCVHFVKATRRDHGPFLVYLAPCLLGLAGSSFAARGLVGLGASEWTALAAIGILTFTGQVLLAFGLKYLAATTGSLLGLSELLVALSLSAIFLGEPMRPRFLLGAALLVAALVANGLTIGRGRASPPA
jgi:drug/metabolite transporter (DMT)-like permease